MTYCSVVIVLALVGLTKKRFGHYAILKNLSLRSPSYVSFLSWFRIYGQWSCSKVRQKDMRTRSTNALENGKLWGSTFLLVPMPFNKTE